MLQGALMTPNQWTFRRCELCNAPMGWAPPDSFNSPLCGECHSIRAGAWDRFEKRVGVSYRLMTETDQRRYVRAAYRRNGDFQSRIIHYESEIGVPEGFPTPFVQWGWGPDTRP